MTRAAALILSLLLSTAPAFAACIDPAMPEGAIIYNSDFSAMQYCRDDTWTRMDGPGIFCAEGDGIVMSSAGWVCSPGGLP